MPPTVIWISTSNLVLPIMALVQSLYHLHIFWAFLLEENSVHFLRLGLCAVVL